MKSLICAITMASLLSACAGEGVRPYSVASHPFSHNKAFGEGKQVGSNGGSE